VCIIAAIDIGTNSVKMTVSDVVAGKPKPVQTESKTTRLGKGVDSTGRLDENAMQATLDELIRLKRIMDESGATSVAAVGTSALRDATNGAEFLRRVKEQIGLDIEIVDGDREAQLAYLAVVTDDSLTIDRAKPLVVFDLGGGSTELTLGIGDRIIAHKSVDIGAVRLTERNLHSDPPSGGELREAAAAANKIIATVQFPPLEMGVQVAGLGGSLVNLATIRSEGRGDPHGARLSSAEIQIILAKLGAVDLAQRKRIAGLEPERADVIIGGALVAQAVLSYVGASSLVVSTRGLRFGLLGELAATCAPS